MKPKYLVAFVTTNKEKAYEIAGMAGQITSAIKIMVSNDRSNMVFSFDGENMDMMCLADCKTCKHGDNDNGDCRHENMEEIYGCFGWEEKETVAAPVKGFIYRSKTHDRYQSPQISKYMKTGNTIHSEMENKHEV